MMSSLQYSKEITVDMAQRADDESLRALLKELPMPGDISISFNREPSFFQATHVEGKKANVIVGRTTQDEILGMGMRAEKQGYVNGQVSCFGYLSSLRLKPKYRSLFLLGRGFQLFKKMHLEGNIKLYLATITEDNNHAEKVLTSRRAGLPFCRNYGYVHTLALRPMPSKTVKKNNTFDVRSAREDDKQALFSFLNKNGRKRQFFPKYESDDLKVGLLQGLRMDDILLAFKGNEIIGSLGFWDQSEYKQNVIHKYSKRLRSVLWAYNIYASLSGKPFLPRENTSLAIRMGSICCVKNDDRDVFRTLLHSGLSQRRFKNIHSVVIGFHEKDPLLNIVKEFPHYLYKSRLYIVHWEDGQDSYRELDQRVPYIEVGGL